MYTIHMNILQNEPLAPYTSLRVGGPAEKLAVADGYDDMVTALIESSEQPYLLGFGCNVLISDAGLTGTTILCRQGKISVNDAGVIADAGVWWDDVVQAAITNGLWGLELTSEIPSSVGGAVFGNIAAYGQQVSDTLDWVDVYDYKSRSVQRLNASDITFAYRWSSLQDNPHLVVLRASFKLSKTRVSELRYDSALAVAEELGFDVSTLEGLRQTIHEARDRAGSLYTPDGEFEHTAGSFFKNPIVSAEQAVRLARYDESGKTLERIQNQSQVHGGDSHRASAAHVLLAAGFKRGQTWDRVRLHPKHVLKVETLDGATAEEVYQVVKTICSTVHDKLDVELEPEVKFIGF